MFSNIHIVLVNTSHSGNIGSSARAMKVMGFSNLSLVNPKNFPSEQATALAVGCSDVLKDAKVFTSFKEALNENMINIGFTSRNRKASIPNMEIEDCIDYLSHNRSYTYNIIFGNEKSGLSNEELLMCDYIVTLPTHKDYRSINLSAAVQIFTYELFKKCTKTIFDMKPSLNLATSKEKDFFYTQLINLLIEIGFITEKNNKSLTKKIHILFNKARLEEDEINMLHGILASIRKKINI